MAEDSSGAQSTDASGASENQESKTQADKADLVSKQDLSRALDDLHKYKKQAKDLQAQIENLSTSRLKEKEDFKALAETYEAKWKSENEEHTKTKSKIEHNYKYTAALAALKKEGLMDEAEKLLDQDALDDLIIEHTDQGRFLIHGKDALVSRWKKDLPFVFKSQAAPKINSGGGKQADFSVGDMTVGKVLEAEKQYKLGKLPKEDYLKAMSAFQNRKK